MHRELTQLRTFRQVAEECRAFPYNHLRYLFNERHRNGFDRCVVYVNGRTLIDLDQLTRWVEDRQANPQVPRRGEVGRQRAQDTRQQRQAQRTQRATVGDEEGVAV
jgi:hypothetical protein